ncbi:MAG: hypothetical protein IPH27_05495 [Actinomycetales bacterium]|nr:hypothetical protein [Candidatus Phosphoribacter baldrii]
MPLDRVAGEYVIVQDFHGTSNELADGVGRQLLSHSHADRLCRGRGDRLSAAAMSAAEGFLRPEPLPVP